MFKFLRDLIFLKHVIIQTELSNGTLLIVDQYAIIVCLK